MQLVEQGEAESNGQFPLLQWGIASQVPHFARTGALGPSPITFLHDQVVDRNHRKERINRHAKSLEIRVRAFSIHVGTLCRLSRSRTAMF